MDKLWLGSEKILHENFGINTEAKNTRTNIQLVSCNRVQIGNVGSSEKENFKKNDKRKLEVCNYCRLASIVIIHELFCFLFFRQSRMKSIQSRNHVNRTQWKRWILFNHSTLTVRITVLFN